MARVDPEQEKRRLEKLYATMEDAELRNVSEGWLKLTDVSREALLAEMRRRVLNLGEIEESEVIRIERDAILAEMAKRKLERGEIRRLKEIERYGLHVPEPPPVVIRRYRDLPEAWIAQSIVESAGIETVLLDDNLIRLDWRFSNAIGRVKLQVRLRDVEEAVELLVQERPEEFEVPGLGLYRQPRCPRCGSMEVSLDGLHRPLTYGLFFFFKLPVIIRDRGWKCHSCGNSWKEGQGAETV